MWNKLSFSDKTNYCHKCYSDISTLFATIAPKNGVITGEMTGKDDILIDR